MLSLSCLSFDFMGTSYDESSDEIGTVQVPSGWKPTLEDSSTLQIFFDYYAMNQMFSKESEIGTQMAIEGVILETDPSEEDTLPSTDGDE
ncbi:hypothetical protein JHK85_028280 [Glycine max]|nr:hypothetical protein JHK85_028280 [Glycine max]